MPLVSAAATTAVGLLATALWRRSADGMGRLWRRVHPDHAEPVGAGAGTAPAVRASEPVRPARVDARATASGQGRAYAVGQGTQHITER
ncbi:MAG: hypothetical protein HY241_13135 [Actinobacteria bacterium]|nr:hypothetical protein [Actinomycetota bacterium]